MTFTAVVAFIEDPRKGTPDLMLLTEPKTEIYINFSQPKILSIIVIRVGSFKTRISIFSN